MWVKETVLLDPLPLYIIFAHYCEVPLPTLFFLMSGMRRGIEYDFYTAPIYVFSSWP